MGGDVDQLDVCVLTEKAISHGVILLTAIPIDGFSMPDGGEDNDMIIAVMKEDDAYGTI
jgi:inorganic pyrophosphatase